MAATAGPDGVQPVVTCRMVGYPSEFPLLHTSAQINPTVQTRFIIETDFLGD
jgi:hypothetical protein